jgi:hypothetical protein
MMSIGSISIGKLSVSKVIIGGNPFSGFSHQSPEKDIELKKYYTTERIKQTLSHAEELGVNTHIGRVDHHVLRLLLEYWDQGGAIQWVAQICNSTGSINSGIEKAVGAGAKAAFIHGGIMDNYLANNRLHEIPDYIARIRDAGLPAGVAGHNPKVHEWVRDNLDVDFHMCAYYNSASRDKRAEHVSGMVEWFRSGDRDTMAGVIKTLDKPVIHYKVLAAGRNNPKEAFAFMAKHFREQDAVCVGINTKDNPRMLEEDLELFQACLPGTHAEIRQQNSLL